MKTNNTLRTGLAAIAAATALSSTLAVAQTAPEATTGPIVLPESSLPAPAPAAVAQPTIVVPEVAPVPVPLAEASPAPAPQDSTPRTTRASAPTRAEEAPRTASRLPRASTPASVGPVAAAPALGPQEFATTSSVPQITAQDAKDPTARAQAAPAPEIESPREDVTEGLAQLLAGLLVAAVAAGGLAMLVRRRRAVVRSGEAPLIQRPIVREPIDRSVSAETPATQLLVAQTAVGTSGLPNGGAAVALPREAPTDFEERTRLLKRMVAAQPDRANPFRSPAARLKRARLIVASLGRKFESGPPRIDLSDYTSNWPALARYNRTAQA